MVPVAKRLEMISEQIMNTGETILHRLQFIPKSLSNRSIPGKVINDNFSSNFIIAGFLSTFTVCHSKSYAIIDKPIYEKVLCTIPLYLSDDNGLQLDVFHDLDIQTEMRIFRENNVSVKLKRNSEINFQEDHINDGDYVDVTTENVTSKSGEDGWKLKFNPPFSGIAHLSVKVDGKHIR